MGQEETPTDAQKEWLAGAEASDEELAAHPFGRKTTPPNQIPFREHVAAFPTAESVALAWMAMFMVRVSH